MPPASASEAAITEWCIAYFRRTVEDASVVAPGASFARMGLDSASAAYFVVELEEWLGLELQPEIIFEHPTVAELARHVAGLGNAANAGRG